MRVFPNRAAAGVMLGEQLAPKYGGRTDVVVVGLARGGVPVAFEVARRLRAPLDVCVVRKLGVPWQRELAMGAVALCGPVIINHEVVSLLRISSDAIEEAAEDQRDEMARADEQYREGRPKLDLADKTVILVDDGLATGSTMIAAIDAARLARPARIVVAVPVAAPRTVTEMRELADEVLCLDTPDDFYAVGQWYVDFEPTTDEEVRELMSMDTAHPASVGVSIPSGAVELGGELTIPAGAEGVVIFAHGAGSSRHSPRNQFVAAELRRARLGTLLMDLLTEEEEQVEVRTGSLRFDIDLLGRRLIDATDWLLARPDARDLRVGYFGASTGSAAALVAAAERPEQVGAIVSRGGRPDLARGALSRVDAPTLLIVGGHDLLVLELNRAALRELRGEKRLEIVPRATHLFEEPGTLDHVADLAREWFEEHLAPEASPGAAARRPRPRPGAAR